MAVVVVKCDVLCFKNYFPLLLFGRKKGVLIPRPYPLNVRFTQGKGVDETGMHVCIHTYARILQCRDVKRLPYAALLQQRGGKQFIGTHVRGDPAVVHQHDAVNGTVKHVLYAVFYYDDRGVGGFLYLINELDCRLSGGGIEVGKGFVKEEEGDVIHHYAGQGNPLLLAT